MSKLFGDPGEWQPTATKDRFKGLYDATIPVCDHNWLFKEVRAEIVFGGPHRKIDIFYCSKCLEHTEREAYK